MEPHIDQALAAEYRASGAWPDILLTRIAEEKVGADPDSVIVIEGDQRRTRRQIWNDSQALARAMALLQKS